MTRFNIEGFSKYTFGLDGSVYHIRLKRFHKGCISKYGYLQFCLMNDNNEGKGLCQQNIIYKLFNPDYQLFQGNKLVVGHLNSNPLDNHISNLCLMTNRQNCSIERTEKSKLPTGVSLIRDTGKYRSMIWIKGKQNTIGSYITPEDASIAYQNKLKIINNYE